MPFYERLETKIYYEVSGSGFPILLFAPGGMRSAISFWQSAPFNPIELLSQQFTVIAMDQRNAGQSTAPISSEDNWQTYTEDHIALLDHLGIERCHIMGGCIGGSYCFGLLASQPERIASAVIQQTIGLDNNRQAFYDMFDSWASQYTIKALTTQPPPSDDTLRQFRSNMYDQEFLFSVDEAFVETCTTPLLVLLGNDLYHPESTSRRIVELAPDATLIEDWKSPDKIQNTTEQLLDFLKANS